MRSNPEPHRIARFIAIGCAAAMVHWAVAVTLMLVARCGPLLANVGGWLVAMSVSYGGHSRFSFRGHGAPAQDAERRFLLVSGAGFAVNELSFALVLRHSDLRKEWLLAAVLVGVAVATYLLSRHWVFQSSRPPR